MVKKRRNTTRSQSISKNSTDIGVSEDGSVLEPVSLSTRNRISESVDYFLTLKSEPIVNFLSPDNAELQINYISRLELEEESRNKSEGRVPTFRDFEFIKVLGKGGFATVYMVRKRSNGLLYAMKTVKKASVKQNDARFQQVLRERNILSKLKNPYLVELHYAFQTKNYYCLVIDLCTGGELFYYLQKFQVFKLTSAKILFAEVVCALEFLHQNNILYRDLKPENILVDEGGHLKLTDFGLCKSDFKMTDYATSFVGSPEYMSPEILLGNPYNHSVDFYTLGVLFYEMVVGLPPFYNEDKMKMYRDISNAKLQIPPIHQGSIRDLLEGLLQKDPRNRLGCKRGIIEIKEHSFFSDINWEALGKQQMPITDSRPPIDVNIFESNFDTEYTSMPIDIKPADEEIATLYDQILTIEPTKRRSNSYSHCLNHGPRKIRPKTDKVELRQFQTQKIRNKKNHLLRRDYYPKGGTSRQVRQVLGLENQTNIELDDLSPIKPVTSRSILSPHFDARIAANVILGKQFSPVGDVFNYRKNTIQTDEDELVSEMLKVEDDEVDTPLRKVGEEVVLDESKPLINPTFRFAMNNQKKRILHFKSPRANENDSYQQSRSSSPFISTYIAKNEHIMKIKMLNEVILQEPQIQSLHLATDSEEKDHVEFDASNSIPKKTPTQYHGIRVMQELFGQQITEVEEVETPRMPQETGKNSESYAASSDIDETPFSPDEDELPIVQQTSEVIETYITRASNTQRHINQATLNWEIDKNYGFSQDLQSVEKTTRGHGEILIHDFRAALAHSNQKGLNFPDLMDRKVHRTSSADHSFVSLPRESPQLRIHNLNDTQTQKLLRFTELAAGVVSERARLPLEPDSHTLQQKLYQEEEAEDSNSEEQNKKTKDQLISNFLHQNFNSLHPKDTIHSPGTNFRNHMQKVGHPLTQQKTDLSEIVQSKMLRNDSDIMTPKGSFLDSDSQHSFMDNSISVKQSQEADHDQTPLITELQERKVAETRLAECDKTPLVTEFREKQFPAKPSSKSSMVQRSTVLPKTQASPQKLIKLMQLANQQGIDTQMAVSLRVKPVFAYQQKSKQKFKSPKGKERPQETNFSINPVQIVQDDKQLVLTKSLSQPANNEDIPKFNTENQNDQVRTGQRKNLQPFSPQNEPQRQGTKSTMKQHLSNLENTYFAQSTKIKRPQAVRAKVQGKNSSFGTQDAAKSLKNTSRQSSRSKFASPINIQNPSQETTSNKKDTQKPKQVYTRSSLEMTEFDIEKHDNSVESLKTKGVICTVSALQLEPLHSMSINKQSPRNKPQKTSSSTKRKEFKNKSGGLPKTTRHEGGSFSQVAKRAKVAYQPKIMPKILKIDIGKDMQNNFRSVTDLGLQQPQLQPMMHHSSQSYEKDLNYAETSVEELNLIDSTVYDDTTYREDNTPQGSSLLDTLTVPQTIMMAGPPPKPSETIVASKPTDKKPVHSKMAKNPSNKKPAVTKSINQPKSKVTQKKHVNTKTMSVNFQGAKAQLNANSQSKFSNSSKKQLPKSRGIISPDFEKQSRNLQLSTKKDSTLNRSYNLFNPITKSPRRRSGVVTPSSNLRQAACGFQAKTSFTATASVRTSNISDGKSSVCNVFAEARDTLAPLNSESALNQFDSFAQNKHIIATLSAGNSIKQLTSIDYGRSRGSKQVYSRNASNNQSTIAQINKPMARLSISSDPELPSSIPIRLYTTNIRSSSQGKQILDRPAKKQKSKATLEVEKIQVRLKSAESREEQLRNKSHSPGQHGKLITKSNQKARKPTGSAMQVKQVNQKAGSNTIYQQINVTLKKGISARHK